MSKPAKKPFKLFYCYDHKDEALRDTLDSHLSSLKRQQLIEIWHDGKVSAGTEWEREIDKHLSAADIVLLLVSADFLASNYSYSKEVERALQRHEEGTARVVPIILRPVYWQDAPFSKLQVLPTEAKPVTSWMNPDEACEDITRGLYEVVKELQVSRETAAEKLFQEGVALNKSKRYAEAVEAFDRVIQLNTHNARVYNYKGNALLGLKQYEEALSAYEQALRVDPDYTTPYHNKGVALRNLKRYGEALLAFEQALRLDPNNPHIYNNKGTVLSNLKRYDEALSAFEQALRFDPDNTLAYTSKGAALYSLKRYSDALEAYERAFRLDPSNARTYTGKGIALAGLKRYEEALVAYEQALSLDPNDADTYYNKGLALYALKRHGEALLAHEQALHLDPNNADA